MSGDLLLFAVGASIATVAVILSALRLEFRKRPARLLSMAMHWLHWLRLPIHSVVLLLAVLATASGLCFAQIADNAAATSAATSNETGTDDSVRFAAASDSDLTDPTADRQRALERFREYANGLRTKQQAIAALSNPSPTGDAGESLPDVVTMIARLEKRLETNSGNVDGWRMLGWSYLHTEKYTQAVIAYTTALSLDPQNAEIKLELEEARASEEGTPSKALIADDTARGAETAAWGAKTASEPSLDKPDHSSAIRAMVDRLANRLESAPHDADGWLRLMRARTVLGESDLAREALRRALATFVDDQSTRESIVGAAKGMGLSAY